MDVFELLCIWVCVYGCVYKCVYECQCIWMHVYV